MKMIYNRIINLFNLITIKKIKFNNKQNYNMINKNKKKT